MMAKSARTSAGILLFRRRDGVLEVFLVHPGGPFWAKKDERAWSIPKGEFEPASEDPLKCAKREFEEETGFAIEGELHELPPLKQPSGKIVYAWAVEGDLDPARLRSNVFSMEWPPRSGKTKEFPEVDKGEWFAIPDALRKILRGQAPFLAQLEQILGTP
jgi:predicted NUDIX family NTP pyrophosphohydrolase